MKLREAAQQALEALEDSHQNINPERRYADELTRQIADAIAALRAALAEDRVADTGKTYDDTDDTDDTPEQRMLRKKWFGGRLYGHLPFLEAVDETMKSLYDKLDEAQGTWKMLDNHSDDAAKMVATIRPEVTVEPVAWMYDWDADGTTVLDWVSTDYDEAHSPTMGCHNIRPLYAAPPKREPLTEEDAKAM